MQSVLPRSFPTLSESGDARTSKDDYLIKRFCGRWGSQERRLITLIGQLVVYNNSNAAGERRKRHDDGIESTTNTAVVTTVHGLLR